MTYLGSRADEISALISEAEQSYDEWYDRRESLGQDRPDLFNVDWDFNPANYDLPALITSWDELLEL
jgi:hypothetical protein